MPRQSDRSAHHIHVKDIYRILALAGNVSLTPSKQIALREYIGKEMYQSNRNQFLKDSEYGAHDDAVYHYNSLVELEEFDIIKSLFQYSLSASELYSNISILDLFAGDGRWLTSFKNTIKAQTAASSTTLIANGSGSTVKVQENKDIDFTYNQTLEKFNAAPSNSISLLLYNPPSDYVGNTEQHLKTIVGRDWIGRANVTGGNGKLIMVVDKDELIESMPTLIQHFEIDNNMVYKGECGRIIVVATKRSEAMELDSLFSHQVKQATVLAEQGNCYSPSMQQSFFSVGMPHIEFAEMKSQLQEVHDQEFVNSDKNNKNWNWLQDETKIESSEHKQFNKPCDVKVGELANIIASGMVDGTIRSSEYGEHIVAGGVKSRLKEEEYTEVDRKGREQDMVKTVSYSEPYLNILISQNGKARVKKLFGGED